MALVSSTFAAGEHLKKMGSIAQSLWWRDQKKQRQKKQFFPMIILFYAREETHGSPMGVDLFWGYSELSIQDGFLFEGERG